VTNALWLRPYVGAGINLSRQSLSTGTSGGSSVTDSQQSFQAFGGAELTMAALPQIALSVDIGHHWSRQPFAGIDVGGTGVAISAHWYVK
jgi:hypothetical protein